MKIFYDTNSVEENGIRTLYGGGTNATTASGALFNLGGVSLTENQIISGEKDFAQRPTVNGTGVLLEGEIQSNTIISGVVYSAQVNVKNGEGNTIYKGQPVYIKDADGGNIIVGLASNSGEQTSSKTLGLLVQDSLVNNAFGTVITDGLLEGFNASAANAGDPVWLGPTGSLIYGLANKPHAPNHLVYLGVVTRAQNNGELFVKVQNGYELEELHNVAITGAVSGQFLFKNNNNQWIGKNIDASSDIDSGSLPIDRGGTGATTLEQARENLGIKSPEIDRRIIGSSTSWTKPVGAKHFLFECVAGGGGGGRGAVVPSGSSVSGGAGGGSGGYTRVLINAADLPDTDTYTVTVGSGGIGGTFPAGAATGGSSSNVRGANIGIFVSAAGGGGGNAAVSGGASTAGGAGAPAGNAGGGGSITAAGGNGTGQNYSASSGGAGGGCGTPSGGSFQPFNGGVGGSSHFISGGSATWGALSSVGNGGNGGTAPTRAIPSLVINGGGGGGGGASTSAGATGGNGGNATGVGGGGGGGGSVSAASGTGGNGGAGAPGVVVITTYF